ncbi:Patulin synthase [Pseudocercospora fuligena]|uniref:Patulin synthase n=1 Tax=Pseudocercospora fuligena TaxID=685502 RepID=A0A8H6VH99_9PEZI|nr:Patulin synthase [Pseudocercospora fuligena]
MAKMFSLIPLALLSISSCSLGQFIHNELPIGSSFGLIGQNATFDYVIVGAGTAGAALAYRLAADGRFSVAVIEAGSFYELDSGNTTVVPGLAVTSNNSLIDWGFQTTAQETLANRNQPYTRGKCLGGSSARNQMVYQRPTIGTLQKWADDVGDQSWIWNNTLKYYKKSSTFTPPIPGVRLANSTPSYDTSVFGDGPVQVSYPKYASPITSWQLKALLEAGDPPRVGGFESGSLLGHAYMPSSIDQKTATRSSSQTGYLDLALRTTQLTVYTHTLAKKLIFSANKTATGVQVENNGVPFTINADKEVIVSAGSFQSAQLLMVSGIGPAETLTNLSIPVVKNLPGVGNNLQDNPLFGISYAVNTETSVTYSNNPAKMAEAVAEYNKNRSGFLSSASADSFSFMKLVDMPDLNISSRAKQDLAWVPADWPDAQIAPTTYYIGKSFGVPPPDKKNYAAFIASITAPLSRRSVSIRSSDMADKPLIDPQWMTNTTDQELAVAAIRRMRQILNTSVMKEIAPYGEAFPGANVTSYEDLLNVVRMQTGTFYHACCTNKMGKADDGMAVVDSRSRVYGVHNLRVADISAFPFLPPGQPQATVYMLAEKIADDILHGEGAAGS